MKTIRYIFKKQFILLMILSVFCLKGQAQVEDNLHINVDCQTLQLSPTQSLTTDQQLSAFQLPFGLSTSYRLGHNDYLKPYVGVKLGAMYAENSSYMTTVRYYSNPWGFYVSPEVGVNIYPVPDKRFGFHVAL